MRCNLVPPHTQTLASCSPHCPQFQEGERPACSHLFCPSFGGNLATSLLISTTWHCWLWLRRGGQGRSWESYFGTGKRAVMVNCGQIGETMTGSVGLGTLLRAFFPTRPSLWSGLIQRTVKLKGYGRWRRHTKKRLGGDSRRHHRAHGRRWPNDSVAGEKS